jgi:murein DD-endopeptidase MepM/ murein hydrolase activator NlpD
MRLRLLSLVIVAPLLLWAALPLVSTAGTQAELSSLRERIEAKEGRLDRVNGRAQVLTSDISRLTSRIDGLQGTITTLQRREDTIQADLDAKQRELTRTQERLRSVRAELARLQARLRHARTVLAQRLVEIYKADEPDIVSVVLNADGFAELLENGAYLQRIGEQDRKIITAVRDAKAAAESLAAELGSLERRQQRIASEILERRNEVAKVRLEVQGTRDSVAQVRDERRALLGSVREEAHELHEDIAAMQRQQAKIEAEIRGAQGGIPAGPIVGGGRFIWPVNGPITSPFCEARSWESCHPGIDIGVPEGTPIRAGGGGTVILAGYNGGYGNYTCIDHGGGVSTCYAHQSAIHVGTGQHVVQGQVIGLVGTTGFSFGAHLHFEVRVNGAVTNPLNYLG